MDPFVVGTARGTSEELCAWTLSTGAVTDEEALGSAASTDAGGGEGSGLLTASGLFEVRLRGCLLGPNRASFFVSLSWNGFVFGSCTACTTVGEGLCSASGSGFIFGLGFSGREISDTGVTPTAASILSTRSFFPGESCLGGALGVGVGGAATAATAGLGIFFSMASLALAAKPDLRMLRASRSLSNPFFIMALLTSESPESDSDSLPESRRLTLGTTLVLTDAAFFSSRSCLGFPSRMSRYRSGYLRTGE